MSGTATGGVHWKLAVRRVTLSGFRGLCVVLDLQQPGGVGAQGKHCAAGSIAKANVEPLASGVGQGHDRQRRRRLRRRPGPKGDDHLRQR
jgi:hypothetical protein